MMRQSVSQIPRRSTSVDAFGWSQQLLASSNRPSTSIGRSSSSDRPSLERASMDRPSLSRLSMSGRPSSVNLKPGEGYNVQELAQSIATILMDLDYKPLPTVKNLLLPSTGTFYSIFEFFLKYIGIPEVWNMNLLVQANPQPNNANFPSSSQPALQNPAALNKARIDLVLLYLSILQYPNIPKPNVIQTMTTPKNWSHMLHILFFLANNCWFLLICDGNKIVHSLDKNREIINEYLKKAYIMSCNNGLFLNSEAHMKLKEDALKKFDQAMRNDMDIKQIEMERSNSQKQYECLKASENELDKLLQEEKELLYQINALEKESNNDKNSNAERKARIKNKAKEMADCKQELANLEAELAIKDALYDKQLSSGKQLDNLPLKHAQRVQELENLQNFYVELETKKDELHMKLMQRAQEVKNTIAKANEIVNKIRLGSSLSINEFPQLDMVDFHRKGDLIKNYKDQLLKIRQDFNSNLCKLPEQFSQLKEQKKMVDTKREMLLTKAAQLEKEIKKTDNYFKEFQITTEDTLNKVRLKVNNSKNKKCKLEEELKAKEEIVFGLKQEGTKILNNKKKIETDVNLELTHIKENFEIADKKAQSELEEIQKNVNAEINDKCDQLDKFNNKMKEMIAYLESQMDD